MSLDAVGSYRALVMAATCGCVSENVDDLTREMNGASYHQPTDPQHEYDG